MGHPPPAAAAWRRALRDVELSRPARQLADWLIRRPVPGRPGLYRGGQQQAADQLGYGQRTMRRAQAQLVHAGWLVVTERGVQQRPCTLFTLAEPAAERDTQPAKMSRCQQDIRDRLPTGQNVPLI